MQRLKKRVGVAILISGKNIYFKTKTITMCKRKQFIMIKVPNHQEEITL